MDYAYAQDRWNLAKTNSKHYKLLKPLLWKSLELTTGHLVSEYVDPLMLENLRYTEELDIDVKLNPANPHEFMTYGFNVAKLLTAVNPTKLNSLTLKGTCGEMLLLSLKNFLSLQHLDLCDLVQVKETIWNTLSVPPTLKSFSVSSCPVSNEFIQAVISSCKKLVSLEIYDCERITSESLVTIAKAKNLRFIGLRSIGPPDHKFDVSSLAALPNLAELRLTYIPTMPGSFVKLVEGLPKLKVLAIADLNITDEDFGRVEQLRNIASLHVYCCPSLNGGSFITTVCSLPTLQRIDVDAEIFSKSDPNQLRDILSPLSRLESLKMIGIYHDEQKHPGVCIRMVHALCWGEEQRWTVTVRNGVPDNGHLLTLHKVKHQ